MMKILRMFRQIASWFLLSLASVPALACEPYVEEPADRSYGRLRPHINALEACEVSEEGYRAVVRGWLRNRAADAPRLTSLALGRAVAYPWISRHLADAALRQPGWAAQVKATPRGRRDALATTAIRDPALLVRLAEPFAASRYEVTGVSFEKVLYGKASRYSSRRDAGETLVPFDAQLWLTLAPRDQDGRSTACPGTYTSLMPRIGRWAAWRCATGWQARRHREGECGLGLVERRGGRVLRQPRGHR
ncbi:MAG: hypothetical protein H6945_09780 [Zoogloeaceae bacterium]|nr:hypothetical protein [Rhodocyclaceae bacterium]MCP5236013.1 hypothetical protein [Zoogloeaceae bacterium]